ncbi:maleylpyruvate isomerase N-terminal domain-containing protein [Amycolatopsis sp. NPDC051102]|uniref:maleylpyruvate isomerase N-terminal domain-containing protein n=1 Tax=Amycolatopsis sp. NPDC051102 TaxID=3155163 RepID=UPI003417117A
MLEAIDVHADGLKRAALAAGPAAPVPNCPNWTVHDLVTHIASVHCAAIGLVLERPVPPVPPADWEDVLGWWDGQRLALREALARNPESSWTPRLAHATAIHRLDAESALEEAPKTRLPPEFTQGAGEIVCAVVLPGPAGCGRGYPARLPAL